MGLSLRLLDFPYAQAWQLLHCLAHLQPCLGDWLVAGQTCEAVRDMALSERKGEEVGRNRKSQESRELDESAGIK